MATVHRRPGNLTGEISRPHGGYRRISTQQICLAWSAYRNNVLERYFDFRVYWALHEIDERQSPQFGSTLRGTNRQSNAPAHIDLNREVAKLVGGAGERHVRNAIGRLVRAGLIVVNSGQIVFAENSTRVPDVVRIETRAMLQRIDSRKQVRERVVPIPRKILKYLCCEPSPTLAATVFGHGLRCLWLHGHGCRGIGICSVKFVSGVFGVDSRSVKRSRARLTALGWLNRWSSLGGPADSRPWFRVNLDWARSVKETFASHSGQAIQKKPVSAPLCHGGARHSYARRSQPLQTKRTCEVRNLPRPRHQKNTNLSPPAAGHLICINDPSFNTKYRYQCAKRRRRMSQGTCIGVRVQSQKHPNLRLVVAADLRSLARLNVLHQQAAKAGLVATGSAGRLLVVSAAERALRVGTVNACGLFVAILRRGLWRFISQQDEDAALRRLRAKSRFDDHAAIGAVCGQHHGDKRDVNLNGPREQRAPELLADLVALVADQWSKNRRSPPSQRSEELAVSRLRHVA